MSEDLVSTLERLADEGRSIGMTNLAALSDVPRSQTEVFRSAWAQYSPERRLELARALVEQAETNIHLNFYAILRELLYDADAQVRRLAIEGLWEDNRPSLVAPLVRLLRDDSSVDVRAAAAIALGRFVLLGALGEIADTPATQAEEALWDTWRRPREVNEVRRRAIEGLAYTDADDVREVIRTAYYDEDELMRQSAVFAMGRSADRRWSKYVLAELESRSSPMRFEAAVAAGELALSAAVPALVRLLDDADSTVREAAAIALGQIGGPAAKRALREAAGTADEGLALAIDEALEEINLNSGRVSDALFDFDRSNGEASDDDEVMDAFVDGPPAWELEDLDADALEDDEDDYDDDDEDDLAWSDEDEEGDLGWTDEDDA